MQIAIAQHYQRTPAALADLLAQLVKADLESAPSIVGQSLVPDLTSIAGIQLNARVLLQLHAKALA
jgi:hypothetical protein